jgi:hypothetical protein
LVKRYIGQDANARDLAVRKPIVNASNLVCLAAPFVNVLSVKMVYLAPPIFLLRLKMLKETTTC